MSESKRFQFLLPTEEKRQEAIDSYARAVGRVSGAWNYLHHFLGVFFAVAMGGDVELVLAAWDSIESDRTKREMLRAAIEAIEVVRPDRWKQTPTAADDLLWVLGRADALAAVRNDAAHALVTLHIGAEITVGVPFPARGKREKRLANDAMKGRKLLDDFKKCEEATDTLSGFVAEAFHALNQSHGGKWPPRPQQLWTPPKRGKAGSPRAK
jgi:hypothetical protein